jgi:glucokinase
MTENETVIVTLLAKKGPMTKQQLQQEGNMGWATVVKMVDRLETDGIVKNVGTLSEPERGRGKRAYLYDICVRYPLAVGIDIEHEHTTIGMVNLKGERSDEVRLRTPRDPAYEHIESFLTTQVASYLRKNASELERIVGIGIGIPRLELPRRDRPGTIEEASAIAETLSKQLGLPVAVDGNVWVYALYEKWTKRPFTDDDFLLVSVRGGLGLGIYLRDGLLESRQGYPGAIAHYTAIPGGKKCRCGRYGCVETVFNEVYFHEAYLKEIMHIQNPRLDELTRTEVLEGVHALFNAAKDGDSIARKILQESARVLSLALAPMISALNVPVIILSGHFGAGGNELAHMLEAEIRERILPQLKFRIEYYPLEDRGFTVGAAFLILNRYLSTANQFWIARQIGTNDTSKETEELHDSTAYLSRSYRR